MTPEALPEVWGDLIYATEHRFCLETALTVQVDINNPGLLAGMAIDSVAVHFPEGMDAHAVPSAWSVLCLLSAIFYSHFKLVSAQVYPPETLSPSHCHNT